jgi:hypothetical protein
MLRIIGCSAFVMLGLLVQAASANLVVHADQVVAFASGPGTTHPNFLDPNDALGAPDYADPGGTGFGTGAVALGTGGVLTLHMAAAFTIGGTSEVDLIIYEIGPSQGGSAEATSVEISEDGATWFNVGITPGGTSGLDIDSFGFTLNDLFRFVRLTDVTQNAGQPAGADIDAVAARNAVPEPNSVMLAGIGLALFLARAVRGKPRRRV